jgi:hypothetical protein
VEGLRARHFRAERRGVHGRYIFDDRSQAENFASKPAHDPAFTRIAGYVAEPLPTPQIEEIGTTDVFDRPIFIISAPRAGSTVLFELLAQSGALWTIDAESEGVIEGIPRLHPANRAFESHRLTDLDADAETVETLRVGFIADLRDRRGQRFLELPADRRPASVRMLEKTTENSLRIPFLAAAFPSARFVFLHRDARQNVSSMLEAWHHDGFVNIPALPGWPLGHWNFLLPEGWRAMRDASLLEVAAFQWNSANQRALEDLEGLDRESWISMDYTELVVTPKNVALRICEFADIPLDEHLSSALNRPVPVSSTAISPPSPIKWRSNPRFRESVVAKYAVTSARLREFGKQSAPPPPPRQWDSAIRYSCFLDEVPSRQFTPSCDCVVHPSFHFQLGRTVPLDLIQRTQYRERFLADYPLLWVEDEGSRVLFPFWVRRQQAYLFRQFAAGYRPPPLPEDLAAHLAAAGVLVSRAAYEERRRAFETLVEQARPHFEEDRFCELPGLLHPAHVMALARYYEALVESGSWKLGDAQVTLRHGWHNELVSRYFHHQLTDVVSRAAGERVRPSYTYLSAYHPGAILKPHVDRKQCVFTLSVLIERPQDPSTERWPLWFQTHRGNLFITQAGGDGVLFRGCELPHWRDRPPSDHAPVTLIFHYVPRDFIGVLD